MVRGGAGWVNGERSGIANTGEVAEEFEAINELASGSKSALNAEAEHYTEGAWIEVFLGTLVVATVLIGLSRGCCR